MEVIDIEKVTSPEVVEIKPEDIWSDSEDPPEQTQQFPLKSPVSKVASEETNCKTHFKTSNSFIYKEDIRGGGLKKDLQYVYNTVNNVSVTVPKNANEENIRGKPHSNNRQTSNGVKIQKILIIPLTQFAVKSSVLKVPSIQINAPYSKKNKEVVGNGSDNNRETLNISNAKTNVYPANQYKKEGDTLNVDPKKYFTDKMVHDDEIIIKVKGYACVYCPYHNIHLIHVKQHIRFKHRHPEVTMTKVPKQCPHCPKKIVRLAQHIRMSHTDPKNDEWVYCGHCNYKSRDKQVLKGHIIAKHIEITEDHIVKCQECGKDFKNQNSLKKHKYVHRPMKQLKCEFCEFTTFRPHDLKKHMYLHKDPEEGIQCKRCDFHASNIREFRRHEKKHYEWKQCHLCSYKTKLLNSLNLHLIHHQGKKEEKYLSFKCKECDYKTYRVYNLNIHMLNHKKPGEMEMFQCYHCNFKANRKDNLKTHIFKHGFYKDILSCFICSFKTSSRYELTKHIDMHSETQRKEAEKRSVLNKPGTKNRKASKSKDKKNGNKGKRKQFNNHEEIIDAGENIVMKIDEKAKENKKKTDGDSDFVDNGIEEIKNQNIVKN